MAAKAILYSHFRTSKCSVCGCCPFCYAGRSFGGHSLCSLESACATPPWIRRSPCAHFLCTVRKFVVWVLFHRLYERIRHGMTQRQVCPGTWSQWRHGAQLGYRPYYRSESTFSPNTQLEFLLDLEVAIETCMTQTRHEIPSVFPSWDIKGPHFPQILLANVLILCVGISRSFKQLVERFTVSSCRLFPRTCRDPSVRCRVQQVR